MYKKLPKRKSKLLLKKLLIFLIIIFSSLWIVSLIVFISKLKRPLVISPLANTIQKIFGTSENDEMVRVVQLRQLLIDRKISFEDVLLTGDHSIIVKLSDDEEAIFSSQKDLSMQIASLQLAANHFTIEGKSFKRLDLRFDKPVVVF